MKDLYSYVPKKYRPYVSDFYKDGEDGYFLTLKEEGKYFLNGYYADYTIHEDTIQDVIYVLKTHIKEK